MLAAFCLRLALGMVAFLPLLPAIQMHPRFFRTQFLVALGLTVVALISGVANPAHGINGWVAAGIVVAFIGAIVWSLQPPPFGRTICVFATLVLGVAASLASITNSNYAVASFDAVSAGLLVGSAVTAMLVGHAYLISPGLTIDPLANMLKAMAACLVLRIIVISYFWHQLSHEGLASGAMEQHWILLLPRYFIGLGGPLVFGAMAFLTARIRSTQSATGILFVVVICTFLGELMSLVLTRMAGWPM